MTASILPQPSAPTLTHDDPMCDNCDWPQSLCECAAKSRRRSETILTRQWAMCKVCGYASCGHRKHPYGAQAPISVDAHAEETLRRKVLKALKLSCKARPELGDIDAMDEYDGPGGAVDELAFYAGVKFVDALSAVESRVGRCAASRSIAALAEEIDPRETTAEACNV